MTRLDGMGFARSCAIMDRREEISMTKLSDYHQTGIERQVAEEAQAKLEQRRYERDHFSDGAPVALYEGLQPEMCHG